MLCCHTYIDNALEKYVNARGKGHKKVKTMPNKKKKKKRKFEFVVINDIILTLS